MNQRRRRFWLTREPPRRRLSVTPRPAGRAQVPGLESVFGRGSRGSAGLADCRRDGKRHTGRAVHGDIDIIPAQTPSRWEMHDANDTAILIICHRRFAIRCRVSPNRSKLEIRNRFQVREPALESLSWAAKREMELGRPSGRLYWMAGARRCISTGNTTQFHGDGERGTNQEFWRTPVEACAVVHRGPADRGHFPTPDRGECRNQGFSSPFAVSRLDGSSCSPIFDPTPAGAS